MRIFIAVCAATLVPALANAKVDEARLEKLVSIICENGGSMETSQAAQILPAQGFTMEETQGIVAELEKRKLVRNSNDMSTLRLKRSACR